MLRDIVFFLMGVYIFFYLHVIDTLIKKQIQNVPIQHLNLVFGAFTQ